MNTILHKNSFDSLVLNNTYEYLLSASGGLNVVNIEDKNHFMKIIWSKEFFDFLRKKDRNELLHIVKGLCVIDNFDNVNFGSTTIINKLIPLIKKESGYSDLLDWLFINRKNEYIPYGHHIPFEITSQGEYLINEARKKNVK